MVFFNLYYEFLCGIVKTVDIYICIYNTIHRSCLQLKIQLDDDDYVETKATIFEPYKYETLQNY